jgi:hypothetical protein
MALSARTKMEHDLPEIGCTTRIVAVDATTGLVTTGLVHDPGRKSAITAPVGRRFPPIGCDGRSSWLTGIGTA